MNPVETNESFEKLFNTWVTLWVLILQAPYLPIYVMKMDQVKKGNLDFLLKDTKEKTEEKR